MPQLSVTVQLLVVENVHPEPVSAPTVPLAVKPLLQLSLTVAPPNAAAISAVVGLHPSPEAAASVITGLVVSSVQVTVRDTGAAVLPHASVALQVRVCDRPHPLVLTVPSVKLGVTGPQLSVAVAVPSAALMSDALGLQPSVRVVPVAVITGAVVSLT